MAINVNELYQEFQQSRDLMSDSSYNGLINDVEQAFMLDDQVKEQIIQELTAEAMVEIKSMVADSLIFRTIGNPFLTQ